MLLLVADKRVMIAAIPLKVGVPNLVILRSSLFCCKDKNKKFCFLQNDGKSCSRYRRCRSKAGMLPQLLSKTPERLARGKIEKMVNLYRFTLSPPICGSPQESHIPSESAMHF